MMYVLNLLTAFAALAVAQQQDPGVVSDPGTYGPAVEIVHLYYDEWPTGMNDLPNSRAC